MGPLRSPFEPPYTSPRCHAAAPLRRRPAIAHARVSEAELAAWQAKAAADGRVAVRAAAPGDGADADLDGTGAGGRA